MNKWQGIEWREGEWGQAQWAQLAQLLNAGREFGWLGMQYPYLIRHPKTGQWGQIPSRLLPDAHWYERAAVQRALFHEGLFSVFFGWEAGYSRKQKAWVWIRSPKGSGEWVNARDFDTLAEEGFYSYPYQPSILETTHGSLLRVGEDTLCYPVYTYSIDPLVDDVKPLQSYDGSIRGGLFFLPPDYGIELAPDQVRFRD